MTPRQSEQLGILQGTLDMLILRTLRAGQAHGHQIATTIERMSDDALQVDHGSLYPALHRLIKRGWIKGKWGVSENNRRAKYYQLTDRGRSELHREESICRSYAAAVFQILETA